MIEPFLKWAGGKRWLVKRIAEVLPKSFGTYIEPFLGSGAVFFHLGPKQAFLGDKNQELVEVYKTLRSNSEDIEALLDKYHRRHTATFYYRMRSTIPNTTIERTARFIVSVTPKAS